MNSKDCAALLQRDDEYIILTHKNPDGDTMGSAGALCSALRRMGKTAYLYPNGGVIEKLLPYVEKFYAPEDYKWKHTIAVDVATQKLLADDFGKAIELCIDHHPSNTNYAQKTFLCEKRSSCGEIILEVIKALCGDVTKEEATLLYIAVSTDTGCFQYSNTDAATFKAASELMRKGADNTEINTKFFRKVSASRVRLEGLIYSQMHLYREGKIVIAPVTKKMMAQAGATDDDMDDIAALPGRIEGGIVAVTIKETDEGTSKVSVRTPKEVSSSDICAAFGGGGHAMAAGCTIPCAPQKAEKMILDVINEVWK